MTNEEAIEVLKLAKSEVEWEYPMEISVAINMAVEALEKNIPKKPVKWKYSKEDWGYRCPTCSSVSGVDRIPRLKRCDDCNQLLSWSGVEE